MKIKDKELEVDFIQSRPLTNAEEKGLSEYIKKLKSKKGKLSIKSVKSVQLHS